MTKQESIWSQPRTRKLSWSAQRLLSPFSKAGQGEYGKESFLGSGVSSVWPLKAWAEQELSSASTSRDSQGESHLDISPKIKPQYIFPGWSRNRMWWSDSRTCCFWQSFAIQSEIWINTDLFLWNTWCQKWQILQFFPAMRKKQDTAHKPLPTGRCTQ